jgi:FKBP-type peptidyl-prolyl cis-trans isomerase SlyD
MQDMLSVKKDNVVSITYELRLDTSDGKIVESLDKKSPLTFIFGRGNLLPKFEENIHGLKVGDRFDFNLPCKDAYGEINDKAIVDLPLNVFEINGKVDHQMLKVGNTIPMQDNSGNRLNGLVKEVMPEKVKMDFNHPLAGNHLFFIGEIREIRPATEEELQHGHAHLADDCEGCSGCDEGDGNC